MKMTIEDGNKAKKERLKWPVGGGGFFLACEDLGRMFDN